MLTAIRKTVIVEAIQKDNTTESGLIIKGQTESQTEAIIISVGPQSDCGLEVGNRVLIDWNRVGKISHENKTYYVTDQSNVIAVYSE